MLNAVPNFNNIDFKGGNLSSDGGAILLQTAALMRIADR